MAKNGDSEATNGGFIYVARTPKGNVTVGINGMASEMSNRLAEEFLAQLSKVLRPYAGYSIFDEIMLQLDVIIDRLMADEPAADGRDPGRAEAYTMALALIRNPYAPDYPGERKRQYERYHLRNSPEGAGEQRRAEHKRQEAAEQAERAARQRR